MIVACVSQQPSDTVEGFQSTPVSASRVWQFILLIGSLGSSGGCAEECIGITPASADRV